MDAVWTVEVSRLDVYQGKSVAVVVLRPRWDPALGAALCAVTRCCLRTDAGRR